MFTQSFGLQPSGGIISESRAANQREEGLVTAFFSGRVGGTEGRGRMGEKGVAGAQSCGNNSDLRSRKVAWEVALRWRQGWEGSRAWRFHGTGVMGQSWTEITLLDAPWPRPGCLRRKDKLPGWTPRRQALGRRAGVRAVVLWGSGVSPGHCQNLGQSLGRACALSQEREGGWARGMALTDFPFACKAIQQPGWVKRGLAPLVSKLGRWVGADRVLHEPCTGLRGAQG